MTRKDARKTAIAYWMEKAKSSLASARDEKAAGRLDIAVNRAYYAAFYSASAVLLSLEKKFIKHSGVRASIHRDLVKEGKLGEEFGKAFDRLFENRMTADYLEHVSFEEEQVDSLLSSAARFVKEMRKLLK